MGATPQLSGASWHALNLQALSHYLHSGVTDCHLATNCICVLSRCLVIPYKVRRGHVRGVSCQLSTECQGGNAGSRPSNRNGRSLVTLVVHHHLVDALRATPDLAPLSSSPLYLPQSVNGAAATNLCHQRNSCSFLATLI